MSQTSLTKPQILSQYHSGYGHDQLLVALHGVTDNAPSLADLATYFSDSYHVVLVDHLGHGLSPRLTASQLRDPFAAMLAALKETLLQLGAAEHPAILLGHSMGGALAAKLAVESPELLRCVILEDPAWLSPQQQRVFVEKHPSLLERVTTVSTDFSREIAANREHYPNWPLPEVGAWAQAKVQVDQNFAATSVVCQAEPWADVAAGIKVPCLVVSADGPDAILGQRQLARINQLGNDQLQTKLIVGAGHCVRRDQAEAFYAVVSSFINSQK